MALTGWGAAAYCPIAPSSLKWPKGEVSLTAYQLENVAECALLPSDVSPLDFHFWGFLEEHICADNP